MDTDKKVIQLSKPFIGNQELRAVKEVFEDGYLGLGTYVEKFESKLSSFFNRNAICVASGTAALHLSLNAIGIKSNDEVLVQSLTYAATYQAIIAAGAIPVSCDIRRKDLAIDLDDAEKKITKKTKAIIPVHYSGYPGNLNNVYKFAKNYNLRVIEDAAHAFGSKYHGNIVGSVGDITCFSFDPVKSITCGEGGAIISNDEKVMELVAKTRILGISKKILKDKLSSPLFQDDVNTMGWRYHMNNINAAIGLTQFRNFEKIKKKRQDLAKRYMENLKGFKKVELLPYNYDEIVPYIFVVKLKNTFNFEVIDSLKKYKILVGYHYYPCHLQPFFRNLYKYNLPETEMIYQKLLSLPLYNELNNSDIDYICECLEKVL